MCEDLGCMGLVWSDIQQHNTGWGLVSLSTCTLGMLPSEIPYYSMDHVTTRKLQTTEEAVKYRVESC